MKKFLTRVLALALVSLMFAMPCMAAVSYTSVTYPVGSDKITVSLAGYTMGDESTVIIVKSGVDLAKVADGEIVNIDQKPVKEADGTISFELPVDERAQEIGVTAVDIYVGGSSLDEAVKYAETITLHQQSVISYTYEASYKTSTTGEFESVADAKADIQVLRTKSVDGVADETKDDVTSSCELRDAGNGVIEVYYAGNKVDDITYTIVSFTYTYEAYFVNNTSNFISDMDAKTSVKVIRKEYKNGEYTGAANDKDVTNLATITAANGVAKAEIFEYGFTQTLNYSLVTLGISGVVNSPELETVIENALVYLYEGDTLKGVTLTKEDGSYSFNIGQGKYTIVVSASFVDTFDFSVYQLAPIVEEVEITADGFATKNFEVMFPVYGDINMDGKVNIEDIGEVKASYTE